VYAVQARPNQSLTFSPHPKYYIAYGDYVEGDVIDVNSINNPLELPYPTGVYALTTTLNANGTWDAPQATAKSNEQRLRLLSR
jgi:GDP-D-mannose dehydratase